MDAYFIHFEELARNARIPQEEWANYLRPLLVGKALVAYTREVAEDDKQDYDRLKEALLMALGVSIPLCEAEFFRVDKRPLQLWAEAARQVVSSLNRILQKSKMKEEIVTTMAISRLCSWVSPDCATYVRIQSPKTPGETATLIAEYLRTHRERRQKYWMNEEHGHKESQDSRRGYVRSHEKSGEKDSYRSDR